MSRRKYYFDNTRELSENIKSIEQYRLCSLSRKQFYENLVVTVFKARDHLKIAKTPIAIQNALNTVEVLMLFCSEVSYVQGAIAERIQETINIIQKVRMHDLEIDSLFGCLDSLIKDAKKIIKEEEKNEQQIIKTLLMMLSDLASEIIDAIVVNDTIFKNLK